MPRLLIKLGGAALQDPTVALSVCQDLKRLRQSGFEIIVVHGGGPRINQELMRRGIQWNFIRGQRVTTLEMMEVIEMVLCGQVNREIVRNLQGIGVNSIGFSGVDARLLECRQLSPELQQVGKIQNVNADWIESLLTFGKTWKSDPVLPVIAPLGIGSRGEAYNINADWAATYLAQALRVDRLLFVTDQNGILGSDGTLIQEVNSKGLEKLINTQVVQGGMLAKASAIQFAIQYGIPSVAVLNGKEPRSLTRLVLEKDKLGTECRLSFGEKVLRDRKNFEDERVLKDERKLKNA
ncbi:MAG: acetylglutamate kinase [Bdellovibrionia bacterium]